MSTWNRELSIECSGCTVTTLYTICIHVESHLTE